MPQAAATATMCPRAAERENTRIGNTYRKPRETFETGMQKTVRWYLDNKAWSDEVRSGEYRKWIEQNYVAR